jgi:hypothetical protein
VWESKIVALNCDIPMPKAAIYERIHFTQQSNAAHHDAYDGDARKDAYVPPRVCKPRIGKDNTRLQADYRQNAIFGLRPAANAAFARRRRYWGTWTNRYSQLSYPLWQLRPVFSDGFLLRETSKSMSEDLALAECFHALLDTHLATNAATASVSPRSA